MNYLIAALLGYLLGCSNLAFFMGKARGFDIREKGSNNAGASNATVIMGLKVGVLVAIHDVLKATLAALLAIWLLPGTPHIGVVAGVFAVLGHIFPFYMKGRGGKGFASFMGLTLAVDWKFFLALALTVLLITLISDYIALGTLTSITLFPAYLGWTTHSLVAVGIVCIASVIILAKHFINIKRMIAGEEIGLRKALSKKAA